MNAKRLTILSLSALLTGVLLLSGCETLMKEVVTAMASVVYGQQSEIELKHNLDSQYQKLKIKCPYVLTVDVSNKPPIYDNVNFSIGGKTYSHHVRIKLEVIRLLDAEPNFMQHQVSVLDAVFEPAKQSGQLFRVIVKHRDGDKKLGCGPIMFAADQLIQGFLGNWLDELEAKMRKKGQNIEATEIFFTEDNMIFIARRK